MKNSKVIMEIVIIISLLFALSTVVLADNTQIIIGGGSTIHKMIQLQTFQMLL